MRSRAHAREAGIRDPSAEREFADFGQVDVAVLIVTYNSARVVGTLLADLRQETRTLSFRVIVVDNDSVDGTAEIVAAHHDVVLVRSGGNIGYAGGINAGRRHLGRCSAVLVLNPDLRVLPGAVAAMFAALRDSAVGAVVPRIVDEKGRTAPSLRREPSLASAFADALFVGRLQRGLPLHSETLYDSAEYDHPHAVDWATGAAVLIRADVDADVGEWVEDFFLYSEETDYMRRIRESGRGVWFEPSAVVQHTGGGSGTSPALAALMTVNRIRYIERYHGRVYAAAFRVVAALSDALRARDPVHRATLGVVLHRKRWGELPRARHESCVAPGSRSGAVIVPAHNEARVIGGTLAPLSIAAATGAIELIVVCNGCTDDTATVARGFAGVTVLETPVASKTFALNIGDDAAELWPRLYLDADIGITADTVADVFAELRAGRILAARPASRYDMDGADVVVRSFYRARQRIPQFRKALWGAGAYGLSEAGHRRIGAFPSLIADDLWVDRRFAAEEKAVVDTTPAIVTTPRDLGSLLSTLRRVYRGKAQVADAASAAGTLRTVIGSIRGPRSATDAAVYVAISLMARGRRHHICPAVWERDDSGRFRR
ncbi:glycosyl transferase, group 2 family protein [Rhodococcus aetherivorans]|uniref:Glycosyl transferase, group 2 family protein n=2 Tax=Rhodococcus aetherivorans TaxID=191292 RepID=A0ABQ0YW80_9NOCA|nr:glycosyltransferase family 2 protein [Rhodococcus aetherivorans]MDV6295438.1 glycosyltransferase family 2 protein [Rhodococcus aetherivorans]GES40712.1 glycosyl transferase, group 2 family protein [Rhodococcus aetherivorans]